jgi:Ca2+-binding RTX toxin-like protein
MRRAQVLAAIGSAGLLAASLALGAPASAMETVNGTGGDDHLVGTAFSDTIRGFGGDDRVHALAGADLIFGGARRDLVYADRGDDTIRAGTGHDFLSGGQGADTLYGGAGRDSIGRADGAPSGSAAGSDVIFGGAAHDFIYDGLGADTIHGGMGSDFVDLENDQTPDTVTCGPGQDVVYGATSENTIATDCEEVHVGPPPDATCRSGSSRSSRGRPLRRPL